MEKYIDLHMHSKYSDDGEFTPTQLVEQCHKAGIKVMAIADHNSVKAIDEAKEAAAKLKEDPEILCNLGMAYLNVGNFDDANYYIERAYELNPEDEVTVACKRELAKYI